MDKLQRRARYLNLRTRRLLQELKEEPELARTRGEDSWKTLQLQTQELHADLLDAASAEEEEDIFTQCMERDSLLEKIHELILQHKQAQSEEESSGGQGSSTIIHLPQINLPTFTGDPTEWISFADLFRSAIQSNNSLSNAQRLQYLKGALRGEPARVIKHLPVTDQNYTQAWELLNKRYNNERLIANNTIRRMFQLGQKRGEKPSLQLILDTYYEIDRTLCPTINRWELIISHIILDYVDEETKQAWELSLLTTEVPPLEKLLSFLEVRARAIKEQVKTSPPAKCVLCKGPHHVYRCNQFTSQSAEQRKSTANRLGLCYNCLSSNHKTMDCKSKGCFKCGKHHNTLLHQDQYGKPNLSCWAKNTATLLPTARITIENNGKRSNLRALLDTGSQFNLITGDAVRRLQLNKQQSPVTACTAAGSLVLPTFVVINTDTPGYSTKMKCYIAERLRLTVPTTPISTTGWNHLQGLELADEEFSKPGTIDIILGAGVTADLLRSGVIKGTSGQPTAQNTALGWVISGGTSAIDNSHPLSLCIMDDVVKRFWELEDIPQSTVNQSEEEKMVEERFEETTVRHCDGTYEVKYPFRKEIDTLGDNKPQAITRFRHLENKLAKTRQGAQYAQVIREYEELGHLVPVKHQDKYERTNYLPHHAVYKDSTTTALRVVFDASAKTSSGQSLNDVMMNGPKLQDDIFQILLRFQTHPIAISADIEKMYRQIRIHPSQQNLQRIVWRYDRAAPIQEYKLTTVTFGIKAAPYLATKVLQKLAADEGDTLPAAQQALRNDFYVDDLLTGAQTPEQAQQLMQELTELLRKGGFNLRKWCSNNQEIIQDKETMKKEIIAMDTSVKTLGLHWEPVKDIFTLDASVPVRNKQTKRTLLSDASRIFDPLGWIGPVTVRVKILFQSLWCRTLNWDDSLPKDIEEEWTRYRNDLLQLPKIEIPRYIPYGPPAEVMLCGFCDASQRAYGAVIYLRSKVGNQVTTKLWVSKSRVAPLKTTSIPRLELCAALLLARLLKSIRISVKQELPAMLWTDSVITLQWISQPPTKWKTFIAHRVAQIQEITQPKEWHYVPSNDNPADILSRGSTIEKLHSNTLWWNGPAWLKMEAIPSTNPPVASNIPEKRKQHGPIFISVEADPWEKYSSLPKLLRIVAYIKRFINHASRRQKNTGVISSTELRDSLQTLIRVVQRRKFTKEFQTLEANDQLSKHSTLLSLTPFIDANGLLRVGGRLDRSMLSTAQKHQIILPRDSHLTKLIIEDLHRTNLHANTQLLLNALRQRYWIPRARTAIKGIIHQCVTCIRYRAKASEQLMGQLPPQRVTLTRPFLCTGVDYCGPITCKEISRRKQGTYKIFIAVFVCLATKAIHLEPAAGLTTTAFLGALERFIARRGIPSDIHSDNGTNFVGTDRYLREVIDQNHIQQTATRQGIRWHFIPPYAPHMGGLWEAGVKSVKYHLRRTMGQSILTWENLLTLLCKIEACLNSRPLYPLPDDADALEALTPGHFLIGEPLNCLPESNEVQPKGCTQQYQLQKKIIHDLWRRWSQEYLTTLQARSKWKLKKDPLSVGDLVIIKDSSTPPQQWRLGRILHTHADNNNDTRVVTVKTATGTCKRALARIIKLFPEITTSLSPNP